MSLDWRNFLAQVNVELELVCISGVLANDKAMIIQCSLATVMASALPISRNHCFPILLTSHRLSCISMSLWLESHTALLDTIIL